MPKHLIRHIFTVRDLDENYGGDPVTAHLLLGRFQASHSDRPGRALRVIAAGEAIELIADGHELAEDIGFRWGLWSSGHGHGQLHIEHVANAGAENISRILRAFCDKRHELRVTDVPLLDWIRQAAQLSRSPELMPDVLQIVNFDPGSRDELVSLGQPSDTALGLIHRKTGSFNGLGSAQMPDALNYNRHEFAMHGRGVILLSGHPEDRVSALVLTASELLAASGRARHSRRLIEERLQNAGELSVDNTPSEMEDLKTLAALVRSQRIFLAVDVRAFADGLFVPELVLDSFRSTFSQSLRLEATTAATESMLETLSAVLDSYINETRLAAQTEADRKQTQWQAIVGLASGVAVPIALILSYFSVSQTHIFDWSQHWLPWTFALVMSGTVITASSVRLRRTAKERQKVD